MISFFQQILIYSDIILLVGMLCIAVLLIALWRRQSWFIRQITDQRMAVDTRFSAMEQLMRGQERQLMEMLLNDRERQRTALHQLQHQIQRLLSQSHQMLEKRLGELQRQLLDEGGQLKVNLVERFDQFQQRVSHTLAENRVNQQESLTQGIEGIGRQLLEGLTSTAESLGKQVNQLVESNDQRLKEIGGLVEKRLSEGFEKTTETFNRVLEHLTRIDEAQKRISELSSNVVSLQEVLSDKRSRGAFGEVQLTALISNLMPESSYSLQHTLSNHTRVDCMLMLPEPTGKIGIDAKFPLESYRKMTDTEASEQVRTRAQSQFRQDIRKHIDDIAGKYIIPGETSDGAVMFIPAESVFAEIHGHFPDLVDEAFRKKVWLVSPTTMMAILTTARAVLKDAATREQVHLIQRHLHLLSKDFGRFQGRMDKLAVHIRQAHEDVKDAAISANKITKRFGQIERVELDELPPSTSIARIGETVEGL
ncbi:DNA recombination protein RmuC [Sedimenticola selenatireducens]|uniref:DNA recombination protein RmuC n=1 Tax=Sedimenticola selenatireducens TaxID=191960 RepID=A0A558DWX5_9GAMM|nr:DNA recombination protein RmuC [Sedimenticola selenatireducens]TVO75523.1 DNA recombination protein RmuC [Sedimenticola selenatireducens]TVT65429.1 MAG: DNA recombination protein RmuC [Sedimenticola selenatireducens]